MKNAIIGASLYPLHRAGVRLVIEKFKKEGKVSVSERGAYSMVVREALEAFFEKEGITSEEITKKIEEMDKEEKER